MSSSKVSPQDALEFGALTFEWGDSYDAKDWERLSKILADTLVVDYTDVTGQKWDAMPANDFVTMVSDHGFVGDPLVHTQHFIGGSKYSYISDTEALGTHQIRAAHQRYTGPDKKDVEAKGHGHAIIRHTYRMVNGEWKLAGIRPTVYWNEFDFEKIFKGPKH